MPAYRNRCAIEKNDSWPVSLLWPRPSKNIAVIGQIVERHVIRSSR